MVLIYSESILLHTVYYTSLFSEYVNCAKPRDWSETQGMYKKKMGTSPKSSTEVFPIRAELLQYQPVGSKAQEQSRLCTQKICLNQKK